MADIEAELRRFLADKFFFGDDRPLGAEESLVDAGIIDSMGVLELISHLEQHYHIKVNDDELVPENLDSIASIRAFLEKKVS
ncbi:MAG: acyl carrier protein [Candidatus Aminicenantales bacterium]